MCRAGQKAGAEGVSASPNAAGNAALFEQVVNSALRYRAQAPLVDGLLKELGLSGGGINGLTQGLNPVSPAACVEAAGQAGMKNKPCLNKERYLNGTLFSLI